MKVNQAAIDLIKEFEGFRSEAYRDPVGIWTIGYGVTAAANVGIVPVPGMTITKAEAEWYLQKAVDKFAAEIAPLIKRPINENQFGAFVSLAYNIGPGAFRRSSALRYFNAGDDVRAADAMLLWNKAGGKVLAGLVRRRNAERALFQRPMPVKRTSPPTARPRAENAIVRNPVAWLLSLIGGGLALWLATIKGQLCAVGWIAWVFSTACGG